MKKLVIAASAAVLLSAGAAAFFIVLPRRAYSHACLRGKGREAVEACTSYLDRVPLARYRRMYYYARGEAYRGLGEYEKAAADYSTELDGLGASPYVSRVCFGRARAYAAMKRWEDAKADLDKVISGRGAKQAAPYLLRAAAECKLGAHEAELADSLKVTELAPKDVSAWTNLGDVYIEQKDMDKAGEAYEKAVQLAPKNVDALAGLGNLRLKAGSYAKALASFEAAVAVSSSDVQGRLGRDKVYLYYGRYAEAAQDGEAMLAENPKNVNAYLLLGRAAMLQGQLDKSLQYANDGLKLAASSYWLLTARAETEHYMGKFIDAAADYDAALKMDPGSSRVLCRSGVNDVSLGDAQAASRDLGASASAMLPADPDMGVYYLGCAAMALAGKDNKAALDQLSRALAAMTAEPQLVISPVVKKEIKAVFKPLAKSQDYRKLAKKYKL